ncbi:MAG TPA: hypothetical protein VK694_03805 [Verrucomicrobiae bacterium]|nr:hypothetical protein [Verrucomicrobiae bacterium]
MSEITHDDATPAKDVRLGQITYDRRRPVQFEDGEVQREALGIWKIVLTVGGTAVGIVGYGAWRLVSGNNEAPTPPPAEPIVVEAPIDHAGDAYLPSDPLMQDVDAFLGYDE